MSLNKENFNQGEYYRNDRDIYREILSNAVSTKEGTEMKHVGNSSCIMGQSEADLDFTVQNRCQQILWSDGTKSSSL